MDNEDYAYCMGWAVNPPEPCKSCRRCVPLGKQPPHDANWWVAPAVDLNTGECAMYDPEKTQNN